MSYQIKDLKIIRTIADGQRYFLPDVDSPVFDYFDDTFHIIRTELGTDGIMGLSAEDPHILLINLKGSDEPIDWWGVNFNKSVNKSERHRGFHNANLKLLTAVAKILEGNSKYYRGITHVYVGGHSNGAAVGNFFAADCHSIFRNLKEVNLVTWGEPKEYSSDINVNFLSHVDNYFRFVNIWDIVPKVPLMLSHDSSAQSITTNSIYWKLKIKTLTLWVTHSLEQYLDSTYKFINFQTQQNLT